MAERLDQYEFKHGGKFQMPIYDWESWLDGSVWRIVKGEDFECSLPSMQAQVHQAAKRYGVTVRTSARKEHAGTLTIQAVRA